MGRARNGNGSRAHIDIPKAPPSKRIRTMAELVIDDDLRSLAAQERRDVDRELQKFRQYIEAKGKSYRDYKSAFRNWLQSDFGSRSPPSASATRPELDGLPM